MKKKLLLVVAALLQIVTAMAQNGYRPLLEEGKIWKYNYHSMMRQYMKSLTISGDTVIRNQTYKKIVDLASQRVEMSLREEGEKVYCCYPDQNAEIMLYDFSKNTGDVISKEERHGETLVRKVMSTETIIIGMNSFRGMVIREYSVPNGTPEERLSEYSYEEGWWIEGIGSYSYLGSPISYPGNYYSFFECRIGDNILGQKELFGFVTDIQSPDYSKKVRDNNVVFDLNGHIVQLPQKGIYIQNGKKMLTK